MSNYYRVYPFFFLTLAILLRLLFLEEMEWKFDQAWMFFKAQDIANGIPWPQFGMKSGGGIVNPGLGVWLFGVIAYIAKTPLGMTATIALLNVLAIAFLFLWGSRIEPIQERNLIYSSAALISVSPLAILFSRNIWAQNLLAPFCIIMFVSIYYRNRKLYALLWGFIGALLGQIHMAGFFYAFGLVLFIFFHDMKKGIQVSWPYWILGSILGSLPMVPWLIHLMHQGPITIQSDQNNSGTLEFKHIFKFRFYTYMVLESLGIHLKYTMKEQFWDFIKSPFNTYLLGIIHLVAASIGISAIAKKFYLLLKKEKCRANSKIIPICQAAWLGGGGVLTIIGLKMHPHYILVAFPFSYMLIMAAIDELGAKWQHIFILCNFVISFSFLIFIKLNHGIIQGEYGKGYASQIESGDFDIEKDKHQFNLKMKH